MVKKRNYRLTNLGVDDSLGLTKTGMSNILASLSPSEFG